ncbi:hypothetical protein J6590_100290, partial [Homalodisca vitripennis]
MSNWISPNGSAVRIVRRPMPTRSTIVPNKTVYRVSDLSVEECVIDPATMQWQSTVGRLVVALCPGAGRPGAVRVRAGSDRAAVMVTVPGPVVAPEVEREKGPSKSAATMAQGLSIALRVPIIPDGLFCSVLDCWHIYLRIQRIPTPAKIVEDSQKRRRIKVSCVEGSRRLSLEVCSEQANPFGRSTSVEKKYCLNRRGQ